MNTNTESDNNHIRSQTTMENSNKLLKEGVWKLTSYGSLDENKKWIFFPAKNHHLFLILKNMSLKILRGDILVESFSFLTNEIQKIICKRDELAIVIRQEAPRGRYFRFKFAAGAFASGEIMCKKCANTLEHYIAIKRIDSTDNHANQNQTISLSEHVAELLRKNETDSVLDQKELGLVYPLETIVQDCILDVDFPSIVGEINSILSSYQKIQ